MQAHVVWSLFKKEFVGYFSNPTGYIFVTLFVFLSGVAAFWLPGFFDRNLANLDQLNQWFGVLLLVIVPAITMTSWASERQEGTDELLLTMPASELELVLGKYLGCVAIYAACLVFAGGHLLVLSLLGRPDAGLSAATYLGYFLAGAALVGAGIAASSLTSSATISFVACVVVCGLLVLVDVLARLAPSAWWAHAVGAFSLPRRLEALNRGVLDLADVAYFVGVATVGIGLAVAVITARRGGRGRPAAERFLHAGLRGAAIAASLAFGVLLLERGHLRVDLTAERLWSLSPQTRQLLASLPTDRSLAITAYVSPTVPAALVQQRETLLGLLREIESASGGRVRSVVVPTSPNTEAARDADRSFGIQPRPMPSDDGLSVNPVFLGVAVSGGGGGTPAVAEFLGRGLSAEYELARALRAAGATKRKTIGVLDTPAGLFGQFDFQTMQAGRDWPIIAELRKQHDVVRVAARGDLPADIDVLLVAQPSALPADQLAKVVDAIKAGKPAIIFEDPMPLVNTAIATAEPRRPASPFGGPPPEPKADLSPLWSVLGAKVNADFVVWDTLNPHPQLAESPNEFIWAATNGWRGGLPAFNPDQPVTSGLQEAVLLFPGRIERFEAAPTTEQAGLTPAAATDITTLVRSSPTSGQVAYSGLLQRGPFGMSGLNPNRRPTSVGQQQTLAALITGGPSKIRAVLVADLDMVSPTFFDIRESGAAGLEFDNVTFVLNAVDALAGDESLVELRKKRRTFRTLERLEERRRIELQSTQQAIDLAESEAQTLLAEARQRFDARLKEIDQRADLDENTKRVMSESVRQAEQRRLDQQSRAIDDQKKQKIEDARLATSLEIARIQTAIRIAAVTLPPVPALLVGVGVMIRRRRGERASGSARASPR